MYFNTLPNIVYPFRIKNEDKYILVKDATINVRFIKEFVSNITLYDTYDIVDGETPELIAEKFYDNPEYHWIVMLVNDRYDYISDFPMPYDRLESFVKTKYNQPFTATDWYYSGSTITVVAPNHGLLATGDLPSTPTTFVSVSGAVADTNAPNGDNFGILSVTDDTFTFSSGAVPTGNPEGTLTVTPSGLENYVRHYENAEGLVVNSDYPSATPISNYTYEDRMNEKKRTLKIVDKALIERIANDFVKAVK